VKRGVAPIALAVLMAACGGSRMTPLAGEEVAGAPTYAALYRDFFAVGKPGHCAASACHGEPGNVWLCGGDAHTCYRGMVEAGLIDPAHPRQSALADTTQSPLSWINPVGDMPFDSAGPFPVGRDAILAWIAAGALDD
jgi:hypothetical protein